MNLILYNYQLFYLYIDYLSYFNNENFYSNLMRILFTIFKYDENFLIYFSKLNLFNFDKFMTYKNEDLNFY